MFKTFLPNNCDGNEVNMLIEQAFNMRCLFRIQPTKSAKEPDKITWNNFTPRLYCEDKTYVLIFHNYETIYLP